MAPTMDSNRGRTRTYRANGLVLKKSPLGESDLIVTFYTPDGGKISAVANGARRSTSKLVGHLEPLTLTKLSLSRGRNLDIITQAQIVNGFASLKSDLTAVTKGLYTIELVDGFGSEDHPNQSLYGLTLDILSAISQNPRSDLILRFFELHLLSASGLMPELYKCVECRKTLEPSEHRFSADGGGTICTDCTPSDVLLRPLSLRALKVLRFLARASLSDLPALYLDDALRQEIKSVLGTSVEYWLGKEIRSNSFLEHLQHPSSEGVY